MVRKCKTCDNALITTSFSQRHCDKCRFVQCPICKVTFLTKPSARTKQVFCSIECKGKNSRGRPMKCQMIGTLYRMAHKGGFYVQCNFCGDRVYRYPRDINRKRHFNFCDSTCFLQWSRSSDNPSWLGDDYPENKRLRQSNQHKRWSRSVKERDKYTCQKCGATKVSLHADHIKPWASYPELRLEISNGRTLCIDCHRKTDTWGIKAKFQPIYI